VSTVVLVYFLLFSRNLYIFRHIRHWVNISQ